MGSIFCTCRKFKPKYESEDEPEHENQDDESKTEYESEYEESETEPENQDEHKESKPQDQAESDNPVESDDLVESDYELGSDHESDQDQCTYDHFADSEEEYRTSEPDPGSQISQIYHYKMPGKEEALDVLKIMLKGSDSDDIQKQGCEYFRNVVHRYGSFVPYVSTSMLELLIFRQNPDIRASVCAFFGNAIECSEIQISTCNSHNLYYCTPLGLHEFITSAVQKTDTLDLQESPIYITVKYPTYIWDLMSEYEYKIPKSVLCAMLDHPKHERVQRLGCKALRYMAFVNVPSYSLECILKCMHHFSVKNPRPGVIKSALLALEYFVLCQRFPLDDQNISKTIDIAFDMIRIFPHYVGVKSGTSRFFLAVWNQLGRLPIVQSKRSMIEDFLTKFFPNSEKYYRIPTTAQVVIRFDTYIRQIWE